MIDIAPLLKMFPIFAVALMLPGPDFMIVSSTALAHGRFAGAQAAAGVASSIFIYALLSLCGLSALFDRFVWIAMAVKILGGLYLIYLGIAVWRASQRRDAVAADTVKPAAKHPYVAGLLTNLTNPKAVAFFTSVFALTVTPDTTRATEVSLILMMVLMAFAWFAFVAVGLSNRAVRERYQRARKVIDRVAGTVMVLFGVKLVASVAD